MRATELPGVVPMSAESDWNEQQRCNAQRCNSLLKSASEPTHLQFV
jgi:hypothetical protein